MKVYFTASSKGVIKRSKSCRIIITQIEKSGGSLSLNWIKIASGEKEPLKNRIPNPAKIFQENLGALTKSEACIFETSLISWGLVYQMTYAITKKIPTLCLFDKNTKPSEISNMLPAINSKYLHIETYAGNELENKVKDFLIKIQNSILVKFNFIASKEIKMYIEWGAKQKGLSQSEFLRDSIRSKIIDKDKEYKKTIL